MNASLGDWGTTFCVDTIGDFEMRAEMANKVYALLEASTLSNPAVIPKLQMKRSTSAIEREALIFSVDDISLSAAMWDLDLPKVGQHAETFDMCICGRMPANVVLLLMGHVATLPNASRILQIWVAERLPINPCRPLVGCLCLHQGVAPEIDAHKNFAMYSKQDSLCQRQQVSKPEAHHPLK